MWEGLFGLAQAQRESEEEEVLRPEEDDKDRVFAKQSTGGLLQF